MLPREMKSDALELHFAALTVLWTNRDLRSYAWFRALFAAHLADVNRLTDDEVSAALELLDTGGIALPSALSFAVPEGSGRFTQQRSEGVARLLDDTVQVAVDLARRAAPDLRLDELWPLIERNLIGLRAPAGAARYARRVLFAKQSEQSDPEESR